MKNFTWILAALGALAGVARADTPANCFLNTTLGAWTVNVYPPNANGLDACTTPPTSTPETFEVELREPDVAVITATGATGFWTLVYDQGFELDIGGKNYFAFFDWSTFPNGTVVSHCATTQMGWYRENTAVAPPSTLGCMSASRADARAEDLRRSYTIAPEVLARTGRGPSVALRALRPRPPPIARPLPSSRLASERGGVRSRRAGRQLSESDFPASFSWTNIGGKSYVGPIRDQLNCGSCYAFGSTSALNAMVRVRTQTPSDKPSPVYSPQDISSCSYYSQGCDGGFPYLVGRWAHDHGVSQDTTFPYQSGLGSTIPCSLKRNDLPNLAPLFVANYSYVGGYFGACSSAGMMESLLDNGPLAISFEVYPDFETFDFSNGAVYRHDYGIESQNPGGDERFRVTNHIVLIVGYGVAKDGTPYWEIMNSWGGNFGMGGMFRIARTPAGQTPTRPGGECAVEEMAVILNPQM